MVSTAIFEVGDALPLLKNSLGGKLNVDREAVTASSLPPSSGKPTGAHLVQTASRHGRLVRNEEDDEGSVVVRLESLDDLLRHDRTGHRCASVGSNGVDEDVVLLAFQSESPRETKDTALGGSIVGLSEVAIDTACGSGVQDAAVLLLQHVRPSSLGDRVCAVQVNLVDDLPLVVGHVGKRLVAENARVVDDNVDATPSVNSSLDNGLTILDIGLVADSFTTKLLNLLHNIVGVDKVIDDDLCAILRQLQSVDTAETGTSSSDNSNLALEVRLLALRVGRQLASVLEQLESVGRALWVLRVREVDNIFPLGKDGTRGKGLVGLQVNAVGSLPSQLSNVTSTSFEDRTSLGVRFVCKDGDKWDDPLRLQLREHVGGHDSLGHAAGGDRGDDVAEDVVLQALLRESLGEANKGKFGSYTCSQHTLSHRK